MPEALICVLHTSLRARIFGLLPGGRRSGPGDASLFREGLRSGPKAGHFGYVWHTEAAGFAAGS
ncbi:hypothetical protein EGU81_28610, partial [Pseudomonas syringae pv. theae]|nr:hypothetical protein [Pseudomonas syringae pv. theae]